MSSTTLEDFVFWVERANEDEFYDVHGRDSTARRSSEGRPVMTSHVELTGDAFPPKKFSFEIYFRKILFFWRKRDFLLCFLVRVQLWRVVGRKMWTNLSLFGRMMSVAAILRTASPPKFRYKLYFSTHCQSFRFINQSIIEECVCYLCLGSY